MARMTRRPTTVLQVSPAQAKLARLTEADLRRLLRPISTASAEAFDKASFDALAVAAYSYLRTGKLTEQQVLTFKENKA